MVKQLKLNIQSDEKMVNKKIEEELTLTNATIYGMILCFIHGLGFFTYLAISKPQLPRIFD